MPDVPVECVVVGPERHGVVVFGVDLARSLADAGEVSVRLHRNGFADCHPDAPVHLQFTDRLFGASPEAAAETVCAVAARRRSPVTATLHDLPQPSDGSMTVRRAAAYAAVASACTAIAVSSHHEAQLLREAGIHVPCQVIPLPVPSPAGTPRRAVVHRSVGVLGFLYPGKGHDDVIEACDALDAAYEVVAIGEASAGHDDLVGDLTRLAARHARAFRVTGHVPSADLPAVLQHVGIPVAAHRHLSASGSLNSWLAAGRRPLAPANRYSREFLARNPDSVVLYPDSRSGLAGALAGAHRNPHRTWLPPGIRLTPSPREVAAAYADAFGRWYG